MNKKSEDNVLNKIIKTIFCIVSVVCLCGCILLSNSTVRAHNFNDEGIAEVGNLSHVDELAGKVYQIDAVKKCPGDYKSITGFTIEVTLDKMGSFAGGAMPMSVLLVNKGAHEALDYQFTYPDNFPVYDLSKDELVAFSVGANAFIGPMAFKTGKAVEEDFEEGQTRTLTFEGNTQLFNDDNSVLTFACYTGDFTINSIAWIHGEIIQEDYVEWERVTTKEFLDIPTVSEEKQNGYNYVDITIPDTGKNLYPVIFWVHGGGWSSMSRKSCILDDTKQYLLSQGYAFVSAEYSLCKHTDEGGITSPKLQMIYDLKAALRFIRANADKYNLNTDFVAAMGESAGGHLSLLLGTTNNNSYYEDLSMGNSECSSSVDMAASYFGPSYFAAKDYSNYEDLMQAYALLGDEAMSLSDEIIQLEEAFSPALQVSETTVPLFITHSKADGTVPVSNSLRMIEAAGKYLGDEDLCSIIYENGGHGDRSVFDTYNAYSSLTKFIEKQKEKKLGKNRTEDERKTSESTQENNTFDNKKADTKEEKIAKENESDNKKRSVGTDKRQEEYSPDNEGIFDQDNVSVITNEYTVMNNKLKEKILKAHENEVINVNTGNYFSFHEMIFDALSERQDITLIVDYSYKNEKYELTIPAGTITKDGKVTPKSLTNGTRFAGFLYLGTIFDNRKIGDNHR